MGYGNVFATRQAVDEAGPSAFGDNGLRAFPVPLDNGGTMGKLSAQLIVI